MDIVYRLVSARMEKIRQVCLGGAALLLMAGVLVPKPSQAQSTSPDKIDLGSDSDVCKAESARRDVSITLPEGATSDKVDVLLLGDDTGSFASTFGDVESQFETLISSLESSNPSINFGFGVARFEDYGGPGDDFGSDDASSRPFILNQPIVTKADAGGETARNTLIEEALDRSAPANGGDGPESAIAEGLLQVATGAGFDGNGDGETEDSGDAGSTTSQTSPGSSGDVPSFDTNVLPASGTEGGVGWRSDAQKIVILATDVCPISAHDPDTGIPTNIVGAGGSKEPVTALSCSDTPGVERYGFVGDAKSKSDNSVTNAVVPSGAGTVQEAVDALNALGVQVVGVGPGASPTDSDGPSFDEGVFLSAMARLTGGVDSNGDPIVLDVGGDLSGALEDAIETTALADIDIELTASGLPSGLSFASAPGEVSNVGPGGSASFEAMFTGDGSAISGTFDLQFRNASSNSVIGTVPVSVDCEKEPVCDTPTLGPERIDRSANTVSNTITDNEGTEVFEFTVLKNFTVASISPSVGYNRVPNTDAYRWVGSGPPPTKVDFTLQAGASGQGTYFLEAADACPAGTKTLVADPVYDLGPSERQFRLAGPNPFSNQTAIEIGVPEQMNVSLSVYNTMGQKVATLVDDTKTTGMHTVRWDGQSGSGKALASGLYLLRLQADDWTATRRVTIVR